MTKNILHHGEFQVSEDVVNIAPTHELAPVEEIEKSEDAAEQYTGPTADDLRREAELFKAQWEEERARMERSSRAQAERIIQEVETTAVEEVRRQTESMQKKREKAESEWREMREDARAEAEKILADARKEVDELEEAARQRGDEAGRATGYESGKEEVERLTNHLHTIINKTIERRKEILEESESQLIDLVFQIARKIIKTTSDSQRNVVINTIQQALKKLKARADVVIRVNFKDLKITSAYAAKFIERIERVNNVTVMEDSTVDPGGAIIETDFGNIDARIHSQLKKIEESIKKIAPITQSSKLKKR
ncbi:MAG: flagellar assembly protein FliH [Salinispira sp.]